MSDQASAKTTTHVYIEHAKHGWIPALLLQQNKEQATVMVPHYNNEQDMLVCGLHPPKRNDVIDVELKRYPNQVLPMQNISLTTGDLEEYQDMVGLPFMHEAAILYNLKFRHRNRKPYTRTGDIVIAVNPYQWFQDLYTASSRAQYSQRLVWDMHIAEDPRNSLEPHVYEVSALSYRGLHWQQMDQSILVSGESGAGKTETVKICLNHIASIQQQQTPGGPHDDEDPTVRRVVESNPLLEAFGNAKTRRNDNSSRFGKYLQLQFRRNMAAAQLVGSKCDVYLLEKSRVVRHEVGVERNFHIFYFLLASPHKEDYWSGLKGATPESFSYLGIGDSMDEVIDGVLDSERFQQTVEALALVGVKDTTLHQLMQAICVVLQLGNLRFDIKNDDEDQSQVSTLSELKALAELMGLTEQELNAAFTERTFTTTNETHKVPLNVALSRDACNALAKELYQRIFMWLVQTINEATSAPGADVGEFYENEQLGIIGLLDIFGFETFEINRFEQLCINYANEKLQQKFTQDIFANVQDEYEYEGIEMRDIWYDDNTDVLDLVESKSGLIALLNEECVRPKGNDAEYVHKVLSLNKKCPCLVLHKMDRISFAVQHYAGRVMYNAEGFVNKNMDTLPADLLSCAERCSNRIISSTSNATEEIRTKLLQKKNEKYATEYGRARMKSTIVAATVWTKYRGQLETLMTNLRATYSRYIRCIKPNDSKSPLQMQHRMVLDQLRCAGVVAGITIARCVFPNSLANRLVLQRYRGAGQVLDIDTNENIAPGSAALRDAARCRLILQSALEGLRYTDANGRDTGAFVVGKTKTYFRAGALELLESNRVKSLEHNAIAIQKILRGWIARRLFALKRKQREQELQEIEHKQGEEDQRRAEEEREHQERRKDRDTKLKELQERYKNLKKALESEEKRGDARLLELNTRKRDGKEKILSLRSEIDKTERRILRRSVKEKAGQNQAIAGRDSIIKVLKDENKRLRRGSVKIEHKLEEFTETSERLNESLSLLTHYNMASEPEFMKEDERRDLLTKQLNKAKARNKDLMDKLDGKQAQYLEIAHKRLGYQELLAHLLTKTRELCTDASLVEEITLWAMEVDGETREAMLELDCDTIDPELLGVVSERMPSPGRRITEI